MLASFQNKNQEFNFRHNLENCDFHRICGANSFFRNFIRQIGRDEHLVSTIGRKRDGGGPGREEKA